MGTIRFFHTADIHFGVENYGKIDPETGIHSRLLDFNAALSRCVDHAIEKDIDLFVFAGDAYKTANPTPTQQKLFLEQLLRLEKANIPTTIVVGNHDHPMSFGKAHALDVFSSLPLKKMYLFDKPASVTIETKQGPVQVVGIPWPTRHNLLARGAMRFKNANEIIEHLAQRIALIIKGFAEKLDPTIPAILTGHLTVSTGVFSGSEKTAVWGSDPLLMPSQLALEPFNYVALGHLHRFQDLGKKLSAPIVYSGSLERIDFGERKDTKGYCDVKVSRDKGVAPCSYDFVKTPTRPMIQVDLELKPDEDQTEQVLAQLKMQNLDNAIVKVTYQLPAGAQDHVNLSLVQTALSSAWHIASITPIHKPRPRSNRATVSPEMTYQSALSEYLKTRELATSDIKRLTEKAHTILEQDPEEQEDCNPPKE